MNTSTLLPDPTQLALERVSATDSQLILELTTRGAKACCPGCRKPSGRVHSHYRRTVADLPCYGVGVRLNLRTRRFFCDTPGCEQRIFTERLPGTVERYARRTNRMAAMLTSIARLLGGEAGRRLAVELGLEASADTLLRLVLRSVNAAPPSQEPVRVLGVDDWAYARGQRYGTILIDLERRRVVDILPDRSPQSLAQWLKEHPGVEVISRDRSEIYAQGARQGAPDAEQVADRWHLLKNLGEALDRALLRYRTEIQQASQEMAQAPSTSTEAEKPPRPLADRTPAEGVARADPAREQRRKLRQTRWELVRELYRQGLSQCAISQQTGVCRKTIRRYLRVQECPQYPDVRRSSATTLVSPFVGYLRRRWEEGCHNAETLFREIAGQGYAGGRSSLRRLLQGWRTSAATGRPRSHEASPSSSGRPPPARAVRWWLLGGARRTAAPQRAWQDAFIAQLTAISADISVLRELAQEFVGLLREHNLSALAPWIDRAEGSGLPELAAFANGLKPDLAAVEAAVVSVWSNGQTEGQVNRLKLIKRSMYGRASHALLRARTLPPRAA